MLTILFLLGCAVTAAYSLVTNLLSPKPRTLACHAVSAGRLLVFAGAAAGIARTLYGAVPTPESVALVMGTAILYVIQARAEAAKQGG